MKNKTSSIFLKYYISTTLDFLSYLFKLSKIPDLSSKWFFFFLVVFVFVFITGLRQKQLIRPTNRNKEELSLSRPTYQVGAWLLDKFSLSLI